MEKELVKMFRKFDRLVAEFKVQCLSGGELKETIPDKYNPNKFWHVVREKSRHYSLAQSVSGRLTGYNFRCGIKWIQEITEYDYEPNVH